MANNTITVTAVLNNLISPQLRQIQSQLSTLNTTQTRAFSGMSSTLSTLKSGLTAVLGVVTGVVAGVGLIGKSIVETTAEMEKYNAVLTNTFGSANKAATAMSMITEFAAKTPFQINTLTDSYVKLVNQGFIPTEEQMTKLGDLASSTGKEFSQLAEAILDAQTGEFERLKEFGIKASKEGDNVSFAFKGVTTTVKGTSEEIQKYILSLGDLEGVTGSMAAISNTLTGKISNLKDTIQQFAVSIGDAFSIELKLTIESVSKTLEEAKPIIISILNQLKGVKLDFGVSGSDILINVLKSIKDNLYIFTSIFNDFKPVVTDFFTAISKLFGGNDGLSTLFKTLGITLRTALTPITLLLQLITAIIDATQWLKMKFDTLSTSLQVVVKILTFALFPIITLVVEGFKLITEAIDGSTASAMKLVEATNSLEQPTRNAEDRYARIQEKLIGINSELETLLANNLLIDIQAISTDPFAWMDDATDKLNKLKQFNELLTRKNNLSTITDPNVNITGGSTTSTSATTLKGSDVNLSTDRSVTNYTIEVAKIVETGGIVFNTENITESSIELEKAMTNVFIKMMGDISNIKMK